MPDAKCGILPFILTLTVILHSTSLPSISSRPSEILFTWLAASSITPLNSLNLPRIPSPSDSPISSCVVSPRLMIEPTRLSDSPSPELSPPSASPLPIAVVTSSTAVFNSLNCGIAPVPPLPEPSPSPLSPPPPNASSVADLKSSIAPTRPLVLPPPAPALILALDEPEASPLCPPDEPPPLIALVTPSTAVFRLLNCDKIPVSSSPSDNPLSSCNAPTRPPTVPSSPTPNADATPLIASPRLVNDVVSVSNLSASGIPVRASPIPFRLSDNPSVLVFNSPILEAISPVLVLAVVAESESLSMLSATESISEPLPPNSSSPSAVSFVLSRNEPKFSLATPVA